MSEETILLSEDTIFRLTDDGDTEASVGDTEKIVFEPGTVPDSTGRLVTSGLRFATDLNPHPNPGISLNPFQDSLLGPLEITIAGYFVNRDKTLGPTNLKLWAKQAKESDDFENGRFGLNLSALNGALNLIPTTGRNGTGYEISEIDIQYMSEPTPKVGFIVTLLQNGRIQISVTALELTFGGSGYTSTPTVTIDPPSIGVTATATATISGDKVVSLTITERGSGYVTAPNVSFSGGSPTAVATAKAFIS